MIIAFQPTRSGIRDAMTEDNWASYRAQQQRRRHERLPQRTDAILRLRQRGFLVQVLTPYQFRVNGRLDLYPLHNRWHDIQTNRRGGAKDLVAFVKEWVRL